MKKTRFTYIFILVLLVLTALAAVRYLSARTYVAENTILVRYGRGEQMVRLDELPLTTVKGAITDARGAVRAIDARGVSAADILRAAGIAPEALSRLTVTASDAYSAELAPGEILQDNNVWLILQDDGSIQLIVFSDVDSRRNVRGVQILEAE